MKIKGPDIMLFWPPNFVKYCRDDAVELGYIDHGHYEFTVIANNFELLVWFSIFIQLHYMLFVTKEQNLEFMKKMVLY